MFCFIEYYSLSWTFPHTVSTHAHVSTTISTSISTSVSTSVSASVSTISATESHHSVATAISASESHPHHSHSATESTFFTIAPWAFLTCYILNKQLLFGLIYPRPILYGINIWRFFNTSYIQDVIPPLVSEISNYPLRNNRNISVPFSRTNISQKSCIPSSIRLWNSLEDDLKNLSTLQTFKKHITSSFNNSCYYRK